MTEKSFGEFLMELLEFYGVEWVFGTPGVHTAELYRGLDGSPIQHNTPRHEQGAGFARWLCARDRKARGVPDRDRTGFVQHDYGHGPGLWGFHADAGDFWRQ